MGESPEDSLIEIISMEALNNQQVNQMPGNNQNIKISQLEDTQLRLKDALEKNLQWQAYNVERENYVTSLLLKHEDKTRELEELKRHVTEITKNPDKLQIEQRRHLDKLLVEARREISKRDNEITRLNDEIACLKKNYNAEIDECSKMVEHWRSKCKKQRSNATKRSSLENKQNNMHEKENIIVETNRLHELHDQMKFYLEEFRMSEEKERKLEEENEKLRAKLKRAEDKLHDAKKLNRQHVNRSRRDDTTPTNKPPLPSPTTTTSAAAKPTPKTAATPSFKVKFQNFSAVDDDNEEDEEEEISPRSKKRQHKRSSKHHHHRTSHPVDDTESLRSSSAASRRAHQSLDSAALSSDEAIKCPGCGRSYRIDQHKQLLTHIDTCVN